MANSFLFKPVLFVQVVPVECDGCRSLDMAEDVRLTSRLEEVVPGSAFGGRASRVQLHAHSISTTATVRRCSSFQSSSPSLRISKHLSRCRFSDRLFTRGLRMRSPALRSTPEFRADLIMDSLESAVNENVRTSSEINGAKREGSLRTGGWGGARVVSAIGDFFRFQLN